MVNITDIGIRRSSFIQHIAYTLYGAINIKTDPCTCIYKVIIPLQLYCMVKVVNLLGRSVCSGKFLHPRARHRWSLQILASLRAAATTDSALHSEVAIWIVCRRLCTPARASTSRATAISSRELPAASRDRPPPSASPSKSESHRARPSIALPLLTLNASYTWVLVN